MIQATSNDPIAGNTVKASNIPCLVTSLCIVCYRRKTNKAISGVVEMDGDEDEVMGDAVIIEDKEEGYDMTPIGMEDHKGDDEYDTMVEINITEME